MGKLVDTMEDASPGDWKFANWHGDKDEKPAFLVYKCPCSPDCKEVGALQLRGPHARDLREPERASWEWDGNRDAPTLSPSILHYNIGPKGERAGEHWHGFLQAGVFNRC